MKVQQQIYSTGSGWAISHTDGAFDNDKCQLVLVFGKSSLLQKKEIRQYIRTRYLHADIVFSSTGGNIIGAEVSDNTVVLSALHFEKTIIKTVMEKTDRSSSCFDLGYRMSERIDKEQLRHVMLISDGQLVNGSELITGINSNIPFNVLITGGLAADGLKFGKTLTGLNEVLGSGYVIAVCFYGKALKVGAGIASGWQQFGVEREVTHAVGNTLTEVDGNRALDLFKKYLGPKVKELPASGLLFPLSVEYSAWNEPAIRTIVAVNEKKGTLKFSGDIPYMSKVRLMRTKTEQLVKASQEAAITASDKSTNQPEFTLMISGVGRKLIMNQRVEEEVEAALKVFVGNSALSGFYSYGELSPVFDGSVCKLHNQSVILTTYSEN